MLVPALRWQPSKRRTADFRSVSKHNNHACLKPDFLGRRLSLAVPAGLHRGVAAAG